MNLLNTIKSEKEIYKVDPNFVVTQIIYNQIILQNMDTTTYIDPKNLLYVITRKYKKVKKYLFFKFLFFFSLI
jgi:hypothetical protein